MSRPWAGPVPERCTFCKTSLGRDFGLKYVLDVSTGNWVKARGKQR